MQRTIKNVVMIENLQSNKISALNKPKKNIATK